MAKISNHWTIYEAAHLLNRAGFGGCPSEVEAFHGRGRHDAVAWLLEAREQREYPQPAWANPDDEQLAALENLRKRSPSLSAEEAAEKRREIFKERRRQGLSLLGWWVERMRVTEAPLQEKMTVFWHDHFPSSI